MESWRYAPGSFKALAEPFDAVSVLGVDHRHRTLLARHRQHVQDLAIIKFQIVIGHVDLERGVAGAYQRRQLVVQYRRRRIADDHVKGVVDMCLALGAAMVVVDGGTQ
ncbi:hypothetical protein D9M68_724230 [compost metagenome]